MEILNKDEFNNRKGELLKKLPEAILTYPTDTIYGIGCNALNPILVKKIRELKGRYQRPFSVIAPSKQWILDNCEADKHVNSWIDKLPGPYTMILKLKNKEAVAKNVNPGLDTLGVRIPDNWFSEVVSELNVPIVTTSANVIGGDFMTSLDDLDPDIKKGVDYIFYTGEIKGRPSTLVFLDKPKIKIRER